MVIAAAGEQQEREDSNVSPKVHGLMLPLDSIVEYAQAFCHNRQRSKAGLRAGASRLRAEGLELRARAES
jgi:hypothetical protein